MCTILSKNQFIGKNLDSAAAMGMLYTNQRGLIKTAAVFPPDRPLEWTASYGSVTFSLSGKEMPVCGINETGLVAEQATLPGCVYPEQEGKPLAGILEATQFLLDTCSSVEQALTAMERFDIVKTSWPVHFSLFDRSGAMAAVEFLQGERMVFKGITDQPRRMNNNEYDHTAILLECSSAEDMFDRLEEERKPDTVWSSVYDLRDRKLYLKRPEDSKVVSIALEQLDFSVQSRSQMLNITEGDTAFRPYTDEANRQLISGFFNHPTIRRIMDLPDPEAMIEFIADRPKIYDSTNKIVLRFLEEEQIVQLPVKGSHMLYVLRYLASKFEPGRDYSEAEVNVILDRWHTFGDYFILRRELIDSRLLKRLPNGSKYWRDII